MLNGGLKRINNTSSPEETEALGRELAQLLPSSATVCLYGDLGAGKTTLIKGIASQLSGVSPHEINSPTFTYLNIYEGKRTVYHFDCYRLESVEGFLGRGFDEYLEGLCLIEWPERIEPLLPKPCVTITLRYDGAEKRVIEYEESSL